MDTNAFMNEKLIDLVPKGILRKIAELPVVECGFGAGPGYIAMKRWTYESPTSLIEALTELEHYRELLRRCHVVFLDGSKLVLERHQFLSFRPSLKLRRKNAAEIDQSGIKRERFRFDDFQEWPETLTRDIRVFQQVHRIMPNVLVASRETYVKMDQVAQSQRELVVDEAGKHPDDEKPFEISGFRVDDCAVEFVLADTIPSPEYMLIYDPEPDFDGEPAGIPGTNISSRIPKAG